MTGNELKKTRNILNKTQAELANDLGVAYSTIPRWEQLKEKEIPNSRMLELSLKAIKCGKDKE